MDKRVFQPQTGNSRVHQRNAIRMAIAMILAGWLALHYLKTLTPPEASSLNGSQPPSQGIQVKAK